MSFLNIGGASQVHENPLDWNCSTTLQAAITAMIAAKTEDIIEKYLIKVDITANRTLTLTDDTDDCEGIITGKKETSDGVHVVTARMFGFNDKEGNWHAGTPSYQILPYRTGASVALGQEVRTEGDDYRYVEGTDSGGMGKVVMKDATNEEVGILF